MTDDIDTKTCHDWVAVSRGVFEHTLFRGDRYSRREAWLSMIALAAWKAHKVRTRGGIIELQRGELLIGRQHLAKTWGWSEKEVRTFLGQLSVAGMIEVGQSKGHFPRVAKISNYERFQRTGRPQGPVERPMKGQSGASEGPHRRKDTKETTVSRARDGADRDVLQAALADFNRAAELLGFSRCTTLTDVREKALAKRLRDLGAGDIETGGRRFREALTAIPHWQFLAGKVKSSEGRKPFRLDLDRLLSTGSGMGDVLARLCDLHDTEGPTNNQALRSGSTDDFAAMWGESMDDERAAQRARFNGPGGDHDPVH